MNELCMTCIHFEKTLNPFRKHWIYECTLEEFTFSVDNPIDVTDIYSSLKKCPNKEKFKLLYKLKDI